MLASEGLNHPTFQSATVKQVATWFDTSRPDRDKEEFTFAVAHMTSAAIRLTTIDEILYKEKEIPTAKITQGKCDEQPCYKAGNPEPVIMKEYIHQLLRDNAAHLENDPNYKIRQTFLESLKIGPVIDWMEQIIHKYESELTRRELIR